MAINVSKRGFIRSILGVCGYFASKATGLAHNFEWFPPARPTTPFAVPLPIPPVLKPRKVKGVDTYSLSVRRALVSVHPEYGTSTVMAGFEAQVPGPTIIAQRGTAVKIEVRNEINSIFRSAFHLHGGIAAPESSGRYADTIKYEESREYHFSNEQPGAMLWFRANTGVNVNSGLGGLYIVEDRKAEAALRLPRGAFDVPLMIQDRSFSPGGDIQYNASSESTRLHGFAGDTTLVNGAVQPFFEVAATLYRFRILNGSNARFYRLQLKNGAPLVKIGTDAGLLQRPAPMEEIVMAPGERVDVLIDFAGQDVGTRIVLRNSYIDSSFDPAARNLDGILLFHVVKKGVARTIPEVLLPWDEIEVPAETVTQDFALARKSSGDKGVWTINGIAFNPANPPLVTGGAGKVACWRFKNLTSHEHPMHIHSALCQIVNMDGQPVDPAVHGWKDTFIVPAMGETTVVFRYPEIPGRYPFHCQTLERKDYAMEAEYEVV